MGDCRRRCVVSIYYVIMLCCVVITCGLYTLSTGYVESINMRMRNGIVVYVGMNGTASSRVWRGVDIEHMWNRSYEKSGIFRFRSDYKNPCWLESLPASYMVQYNSTVFNQYGRPHIAKLRPVYDHRLLTTSRPWRIRCLPYVYLIGVTKSGTTDFYNSIVKHREVHEGWVKEPMYWNRRRYPQGVVVHRGIAVHHMRFGHYLNMFDYPSDVINRTAIDAQNMTAKYHRHITVDGSSYLLWEDNGWESDPRNKGLTQPKYTTPMALHAVQPLARLILLLRNPTDRVYSAYNMYAKQQTSPDDFQHRVQKSITMYNACFKMHGLRACAYNATLARALHPLSLRSSLYAVFLEDWLAVFSREQFMIIKSEDYYSDRMETFREVIKFLELSEMPRYLSHIIQQRKPTFKRYYQPMLPATRLLLQHFFQPFNKQLELLLNRTFWIE